MKAVQVNARAGTFGDVAGSTTFAELEPVDRQWLREVWTPYPAKATPARRVTLMLTVLPGTAAVAYELQEDDSLFRQLVSLYALWGWTAIEDVQAQLARLSLPRPALAVLVEKTCDLLRARIVVELAAIEAEVGVLAHSRWKATAKQLQAWKQDYTAITKSQYVFAKADVWAAANRHLSAYHELRRKRLRSEDLRASKPGLGRDYVPGENDDRYPAIARTFGEQEKAYARTAAQELGQLYRICPPAVMVADSTAKLFDPTSGVPAGPQTAHGVRLAHSHRESGLATTIVEMLVATGEQLDGLIRSLRLDGVAELASKRGGLERSRAEHWNQAGTGAERIVARRCLERWTLDAVVRRSLTTPVGLVDASAAFVMESEANTVLGMPDLVRAYAIDPKASRRSAFHTCVATHYLHTLEAELEAVRRDAERFRTLVTVINWIASVVAVVAFVASTVASGGATLPGGIVAACAIIEGADAALGVAVLALTVVDVAGQAGEAQLQHQQAIALLSVESAETARMVGATLATCHRLGVAVTAQVAQVLIQSKTAKLADGLSLRLGIPNRAKLAQRALELEWLADDIGAAVEDGVLVFDTRRGTP